MKRPLHSILIISGGTNYFNDTCTPWPAQAQDAFNYAAGVWATYLRSSVPITINACWATNLASGVLGHSGARNYYRDFSGAPAASTWYTIALANALHGSDLDPANPDMDIAYSSTYNWYFGTDGNPGSGQYDFVSVIMHEIAHGLGFLGFVSVSNGVGSWGSGGYPTAYDRFTENGSGQGLINTSNFLNPSTALATQLTSNNIYFDGTKANAGNGGTRPKLYAPATWSSGSSYGHLDYNTYIGTVNALMIYAISAAEARHVPGPVALGILQDLGWSTAQASPASMISPASGSVLGGSSVTFTWTDASAQSYQIWVGSSTGFHDYGYWATTATSTTVTGLPTDGRPICVRLYSQIGGNWYYNDYVYLSPVQ